MTGNGPKLSIVVIIYDMLREAPRTLFSLSSEYQRDVDPLDYEVIVIDNGSAVPLDKTVMPWPNFRYRHIADADPSPASAINYEQSPMSWNPCAVSLARSRDRTSARNRTGRNLEEVARFHPECLS